MFQNFLISYILFTSTLMGQQIVSGHKYFGFQKEKHLQLQQKHTNVQNGSPGISIVQGQENARYDISSNGGDERRLWVLQDGSAHAVYFGSTTEIGRRSFYTYSPDCGPPLFLPIQVESEYSQFPSMDILPDGRPVITSHKKEPLFGVHINIMCCGGSAFKQYDAPAIPVKAVLPRIAVASDSIVVLFASSAAGDENVWNAFNINSETFLHKQNKVAFPGIKERYRTTLASNQKGRVAMIIANKCSPPEPYPFVFPLSGIPGENNIWLRESFDGGYTWHDPVMITDYSSEPDEVQTGISWHLSAMYVGDELHVVWIELLATLEGFDYPLHVEGQKIMHWAPHVNNGQPTVAVQWDSLHFGCHPLGRPSLWFPSIGTDEDGVLSIVFTSVSTDTADVDTSGYPFAEISAVSSADNGLTWGEPLNLTNSPGCDDGHPYISQWNQSGKINVLYTTDNRAGYLIWDRDYRGDVDHLFLQTDRPSTEPYQPSKVQLISRHSPKEFVLKQNYPNPFNPETTIEYQLPDDSHVCIAIYDLLGRHVRTLVDARHTIGTHFVSWNGSDMNGVLVSSGVYTCRLEAGEYVSVIKLALVR
ncbi:MAG: T9SS type A sorting domain-containing protein [Candidatus Lokiarchaeota archaeon]|nr:T9SS type A sorting domain-containing protein [Candidatus Lokiarchaeota archaeon]